MQLINYNVTFYQYSTNVNFKVAFNSATFTNTGNSIVQINNITIPVGGYLTINGNLGEQNYQQYFISFAGTESPQLTIVCKEY